MMIPPMMLAVMVMMMNMMIGIHKQYQPNYKGLRDAGILESPSLILSFLRNSIHLIRICLKISKNFRNTHHVFPFQSFVWEGCANKESNVDIAEDVTTLKCLYFPLCSYFRNQVSLRASFFRLNTSLHWGSYSLSKCASEGIDVQDSRR